MTIVKQILVLLHRFFSVLFALRKKKKLTALKKFYLQQKIYKGSIVSIH